MGKVVVWALWAMSWLWVSPAWAGSLKPLLEVDRSSPVAWLTRIVGNPQLILPAQAPGPGTKTSSLPYAKPLSALYTGYELILKAKDSVTLLVPYSSTRRVYQGPARLRVRVDNVQVRWGEEPRVARVPQSHFDTLAAWLTHSHPPKAAVALAAEGVQVLHPLNAAMLLTREVTFQLAGEVPDDAQLILYGPDGKRFWVEQVDSPTVDFPPAADFDWGQRFTWELRKKTGGRLVKGEFSIAEESMAARLLSQKLPIRPETPQDDLLIYGLKLDMMGAFHEAEEVFSLVGITHDRSRWPVRLPAAARSTPN